MFPARIRSSACSLHISVTFIYVLIGQYVSEPIYTPSGWAQVHPLGDRYSAFSSGRSGSAEAKILYVNEHVRPRRKLSELGTLSMASAASVSVTLPTASYVILCTSFEGRLRALGFFFVFIRFNALHSLPHTRTHSHAHTRRTLLSFYIVLPFLNIRSNAPVKLVQLVCIC